MASKAVGVQVPPFAPSKRKRFLEAFFFMRTIYFDMDGEFVIMVTIERGGFLDIRRIRDTNDQRFTKTALEERGAFLIQGEVPCSIEITKNHEAVVDLEDMTYLDAVLEEFRFYAEHIIRFHDREGNVLREFPPVETFRCKLEALQPSQFCVAEDRVHALHSRIQSPEDVCIPVKNTKEGLIMLDGHTRAYIANQKGFAHVRCFYADTGEDIIIYVNEARKRGIKGVENLESLPEDAFHRTWVQFCDNVQNNH